MEPTFSQPSNQGPNSSRPNSEPKSDSGKAEPQWREWASGVCESSVALFRNGLSRFQKSFVAQVVTIIGLFAILTIGLSFLVYYQITFDVTEIGDGQNPLHQQLNTPAPGKTSSVPEWMKDDPTPSLQTSSPLAIKRVRYVSPLKVTLIAVAVLLAVMVIVTLIILFAGQRTDQAIAGSGSQSIAKSPYYYVVAVMVLVASGVALFFTSRFLLHKRSMDAIQKHIDRSDKEVEIALQEIKKNVSPFEYGQIFNHTPILDLYNIDPHYIAMGCYGVVYKAVEKSSGKLVAAKRSRLRLYKSLSGKAGSDEGLEIRGLIQEILLMRRLQHPNIIAFKDAFLINQDVWIVMEFGENGSVWRAVRKTDKAGFPENVVAMVLGDAVSALAYLHDMCIIHRDIKPHNWLITGDGFVKIIDFGTALQLTPSVPCTAQRLGTVEYFAPEYCSSRPYHLHVDIWAVGISALVMAEGKSVRSDLEDPKEAMKGILEHPIPDYDRSKYSEEFNDFVTKCLTVDVDQRAKASSLLEHPFLKKACSRTEFLDYLRSIGAGK